MRADRVASRFARPALFGVLGALLGTVACSNEPAAPSRGKAPSGDFVERSNAFSSKHGDGEKVPGESVEVVLQVPPGSQIGEMHLYGADALTLEAGVTGATTGVSMDDAWLADNTIKTLFALGSMELGVGSVVERGFSVGQSGPGSVTEQFQLSPAPEPVSVKWTVLIPEATATSVALAEGKEQSLEPGRYTTVSVAKGATLTLEQGMYFFESLRIDEGATLNLQDGGVYMLHVRTGLAHAGRVEHPSKTALGVIFLGTEAPTISGSLEGTLVAPLAELRLAGPADDLQRGSFFAKSLTVAENTKLQFVPGNVLVPQFTTDLESCIRQICSAAHQEDAEYEAAITRYCHRVPDLCEADVMGQANADSRVAAAQVAMESITPGHYMAVSRDRTLKLRRARANREVFCEIRDHDQDADLVSDSSDSCPDTPALTPTDEQGCPREIPEGADPGQIKSILDATHFTIAHHCKDSEDPAPPFELKFETTYLDFRDERQPATDCPTYYQVRFQSRSTTDVDSNGSPLIRTLIVFPPLGLLQENGAGARFFHFVPDHPGASQDTVQAVLDFTNKSPQYVRVSMRAVLPSGQRSEWSAWTEWQQR